MKKRNKNRANRISIFLDEFGLDQFELAELLNISKDTVSRWCRNVAQPSISNLRKIAELGHTNVQELLEPTIWDETDGLSPIEVFLEEKAKKNQNNKMGDKIKRKKNIK